MKNIRISTLYGRSGEFDLILASTAKIFHHQPHKPCLAFSHKMAPTEFEYPRAPFRKVDKRKLCSKQLADRKEGPQQEHKQRPEWKYSENQETSTVAPATASSRSADGPKRIKFSLLPPPRSPPSLLRKQAFIVKGLCQPVFSHEKKGVTHEER
jgi:hypothetical protein